MKWRPMVWMLVSLCLLTGCASLLERTYSKVEPHSSRFWESEAADTLRAENYQDIVNDLLILIGQHTESASLRLYNFEDDLAPWSRPPQRHSRKRLWAHMRWSI